GVGRCRLDRASACDDRPRLPRAVLLSAGRAARARDRERPVGAGQPPSLRAGRVRAVRALPDDRPPGVRTARAARPHRPAQGARHVRPLGRTGPVALAVVGGLLPGGGRPARAHGHLERPPRRARLAAGVGLPGARAPGAVALYVVNHLADHVAEAALAVANPNESLYRRLQERAGIVPRGGRRTLEARAAEPWLAELLELDAGAPVAFIESVAWDADMRPFDCYRAWLRTDRVRVDIQAAGRPPEEEDDEQ